MIKKITLLLCVLGAFNFTSAQIGNYAVGQGSSAAMTSDDYNVAVGDSTLVKQVGEHYVTALGYKAGYNNDADENVFIGYEAGFTNITGADNLFVGFRAGYYNTATDGTFLGNAAGFNNTDGADNTYIGERSGSRATSGDDNTYIGASAGPSYFIYATTTATTSPATGSDNTAVGSSAGYNLTTGYRNVFVGNEAGWDNTTGYWNTFVGDSAGTDVGVGFKNTFIGQGAGAATEHADENTFIGVKAGWDNNRTNDTDTSDRNTAVGAYAGFANREGEDNVVMGAFADFANNGSNGTTGQEYNARNIIIGASARLDGGSYSQGANDAIIMGYNADGDASQIVGIGSESDVLASGSIGIGYLANIAKLNTVGIGYSVDIDNKEAVAIGANTIIQNDGAIVLGYGANSTDLAGNDEWGDPFPKATNTIAIGYNAASSGGYSVAIGSNATAATDNTMVLGGATYPLSVGIGTDVPNANASLTLDDTNKGLLVNRLTTAQKTTLEGNLTTVENGMVVYDTDLKGLYVWDGTQWLNTLADNLGSHTATTTLDMATNNIEEVTYLDFDNVYGNGIRFWNGNDNYKITYGNGNEYNYGSVTSSSIKTTNSSGTGRGWTWGVNGQTPIAAIDNTGKMQIAGDLTIGAYTLPNTDGTTDQVLSTDGTGAVTWVDATLDTDAQDLELSLNTLSLTNDGTTVDLSGYLDNTDSQELSLSSNILSISGGGNTIDLSGYLVDTLLTEAQVDSYVSNNGYLTTFTEVDGSTTNEIQSLSLSSADLTISSGNTIDLSSLTSDLEIRVTALENAAQASGTDKTPQQFNYQAAVRDGSGSVLANTLVNYQISILKGSSSGITSYSETHSATTSSKGLTNLSIGSGTLVSGDFTTIDWANDIYYLQIEADVTGGTSYQKLGTSQLVSVPYALHAKSADYLTGMSSSKLKKELEAKDAKIEKLENEMQALKKLMIQVLNKKL
ncbi:MAG: hypothetical protein HRT69_00905 [Flavobacteriaceae bacterium]|nr:hypothetical protein [Flavobacteriaceae bacterium]